MIEKINISQLENGEPVLAGLHRGQRMFNKLLSQLPRSVFPQPLFLDFRDVGLATGSYLREAVLKLKRHCRDEGLNIYPVLANINEGTLQELDLALKAQSDAIFICNLDTRGKVTSARLVGVLEDKDLKTFEAVSEGKEVDAASLADKYAAQERIGPTGWNNRLASLVSKGILREIRRGRAKFYRLVLEVA